MTATRSSAFAPAMERTAAVARYEERRIGAWFGADIHPWAAVEAARKRGESPLQVVPPVRYDAKYNAAALAQVGVRYAVVNAKESDGECAWDSAHTDHDITRWGKEFGDPVNGVLASFLRALREHGLSVGLNYCYGKDQHHQVELGWSWDRYFRFADQQLEELLTGFGPIDEIWFTGVGQGRWSRPIDGQYEFPRRRMQEAYDKVKSLQPDCLVAMHARYSWRAAYPTDIFQPGDGMPPETGYDPWKEWEGKRYYIPQETYVVAMPDSDVTTMALLCHEIIERGANALLILDSRIDEQGRFLPETLAKLQRWREILDALPPNRHALALSAQWDRETHIVAEVNAPTDLTVKEKSQRQAVARWRALREGEKSLRQILLDRRLQGGRIMTEWLATRPDASGAVHELIATAPILARSYRHEPGCDGPPWCAQRDHREDCRLVIGVPRQEIEHRLGVRLQ